MKIKEIKIINQDESTEIADIGADAINVDYNDTTVKAELDKLNTDNNSNKNIIANLQSGLNTTNSNLTLQTSRIDNLAHLDEGSTTGDAELIDIRTGYDGIGYSSAGESVRKQISDIHESLSVINGEEILSYSRFGYNYVNVNTEPTLDTYGAYIHNSTPIHLSKGDEIKIKSGVKFTALYKNDSDNLYYKATGSSFRTSDFKIIGDGLYYITLSYTPERYVANNDGERALLGSYLKIIKKENSKLSEIDTLKYKSNNFITGLNERSRNLLKTILEKAVFTDDVSDLIIELYGELVEKGKLFIAQDNKRISEPSGRLVNSETMCLLKDYYLENPVKKITFFIDNGGNEPERNFLLLLNKNGETVTTYLMANAGRTNQEWTANVSSADYYIEGIRLSIYSEYKDNCYAYETESGNIIYAGKNSIYAGKANIDE